MNSSDPKHNPPESVQPEDTPGNPGEPPIIPEIPPSPANPPKPSERGQDRTPRWKKCVEIGAFVIGLAYTFFACVQWRALLDSNKINREALESVQRAFVSFTDNLDPRVGTDTKTGKKAWAVIPHIQNSGNTAALNYRGYVNINSPDYNALPPNFDYADKVYTEGSFQNTNVKGGHGVLAPHDTTGLGLIGIPDEVLDRVNKGTAHVYLWGWVGMTMFLGVST